MPHKLTALTATRVSASKSLEQVAQAGNLSLHYLARAEGLQPDEMEVAETARIAVVLSTTLTTLGKVDTK
jgi:hypothetical protein